MIDLNKIVNDSLKKIEEGKFVEEVVQKRIEKTIAEIVDDTFRGYSDFGKNLKKHIEENLNINLGNLNLDGYNTLVLSAVKEKLDKVITVQGVEKIKESLDEMLKESKSEYTLSEIIEKAKQETHKEEYEFDYDDHIHLKINKSYSFTHIYISAKEDEPDYDFKYEYQISIDEEGKPYCIKLEDEEINTKKILGGLYGLDELLFKIYASGAKIVLDNGTDPEDYDLNYREDF